MIRGASPSRSSGVFVGVGPVVCGASLCSGSYFVIASSSVCSVLPFANCRVHSSSCAVVWVRRVLGGLGFACRTVDGPGVVAWSCGQRATARALRC